MKIVQTGIEGLVVLEPTIWNDDRGYFYEAYNQQVLEEAGLSYTFVQDNQARSTYGVLRGLHYQLPPYAQAKLVRVLEGEVLDVVVDIRPESTTYGQSFSIVLSDENKKQLLVPRGFAHGYAVLSPTAEFFYKCDNYYQKTAEGGILYKDAALKVDWQLPADKVVVSEKDAVLPLFGAHIPFK